MSSYFENLREKTDYILDAIKAHPFIIQLLDGTLPRDVFRFYIKQDALYLSEYKKILASVGSKCKNASDTQFFLSTATDIIDVEDALHRVFIQEEHFTDEPSPVCELYTSYLTRMVSAHSLEEGMAAVLPCFTIYGEIGDYILAHQTNKENNPYRVWINTYGGEAFAASVKRATDIFDTHAGAASREALKDMERAFIKSSKLEWMFWDSAFRKEWWEL